VAAVVAAVGGGGGAITSDGNLASERHFSAAGHERQGACNDETLNDARTSRATAQHTSLPLHHGKRSPLKVRWIPPGQHEVPARKPDEPIPRAGCFTPDAPSSTGSTTFERIFAARPVGRWSFRAPRARVPSRPAHNRCAAPAPQVSTKVFRFFERLGWRSLRSALASICRMRSRVTSKSWPTSSSV